MKNPDYKKNSPQINRIVDILMVALKDMDIYVYHRAVNTSSVYLKFKDTRIRSLTVRDHKTIPKYQYKWNIVLGYTGPAAITDRGVTRYMYNEKQIQACVSHIKNYANKIHVNESLTKQHD